MNVLLAFLLYKNLSDGDIMRLRPYLPIDTRRGLAAVEAYERADPSAPLRDFDSLADSFQNNRFTFLLLKLLSMRNNQHGENDVFSILKCLLPADIMQSIPDPQMLMGMMELIKSMSLESESSSEEDLCRQDDPYPEQDDNKEDNKRNEKRNECSLNKGQLSFLKGIVNK